MCKTAHAINKMQNDLPALCEKYALKSLDEPIEVDWSEDSLRLAESLVQYLAIDEYKARAMQAIMSQGASIEGRRQADFDQLLLSEFKSTNDSTAVAMRTALMAIEPTDAELLNEAKKWFENRE